MIHKSVFIVPGSSQVNMVAAGLYLLKHLKSSSFAGGKEIRYVNFEQQIEKNTFPVYWSEAQQSLFAGSKSIIYSSYKTDDQSVAATTWNSLPLQLCFVNSVTFLEKQVKAFLLNQAFCSDCFLVYCGFLLLFVSIMNVFSKCVFCKVLCDCMPVRGAL